MILDLRVSVLYNESFTLWMVDRGAEMGAVLLSYIQLIGIRHFWLLRSDPFWKRIVKGTPEDFTALHFFFS